MKYQIVYWKMEESVTLFVNARAKALAAEGRYHRV